MKRASKNFMMIDRKAGALIYSKKPLPEAFMNEYYTRYDARYKAVYEAGAERWGHDPKDTELTQELTKWVNLHALKGKNIIEFAAGEGAGGYVLSSLGCIYTGVEISPAAVKKAEALLSPFKNASLRVTWSRQTSPLSLMPS